ncbi:MAG: 2-oxoacid:acceptor oxidoreductase subunit alpha [Bacteroidales bacterium]|nr:2-oxoacid:acceptor oxidoreductase subunit alpha [Bacteroidales bacterium]
MAEKKYQNVDLEDVVIRFSGDSGDGMQLTGTLFSETSALVGNDFVTFPDFPAEIRAPQGTVGGVSGFQVHIGHQPVYTPGDYCDVLIAMNPAALKANRRWAKKGAIIIINSDEFTEKNLQRAGYKTLNPIEEDKLEDYNIIFAPINELTKEALKDSDLDQKSILRSKNMFALGICYWMFDRPMEHTIERFEKKFAKVPAVAKANIETLKAGYNYAENIGAFKSTFEVAPSEQQPGKYRSINGNTATAWGLAAAAERAHIQLFCGSYPITPATDILIELTKLRSLGIKALQVEDEIAGICTAIGASFAGSLGVTSTSGPGLALKAEASGLAVITELPLVIIDVQRGGPSTGLPTKTEQADLLQALYGRNGESPMVVLAATTPSDCFYYAFQAAKIALEHMTPVILLTDGFIGNGSEPFRIPKMEDLPEIHPHYADPNDTNYQPYRRDPKTFARYWAKPGIKGLEHRIGGLEKMAITGSVSYVPENHAIMVEERAEKVRRVVEDIPDQEILGDQTGDILMVGWGSTRGHLLTALKTLRKEGKKVGMAQFSYINPLPKNTEDVFKRFKKVIVFEVNTGQFVSYLRSQFGHLDFLQYDKVQGLPFTAIEIVEFVNKMMEE